MMATSPAGVLRVTPWSVALRWAPAFACAGLLALAHPSPAGPIPQAPAPAPKSGADGAPAAAAASAPQAAAARDAAEPARAFPEIQDIAPESTLVAISARNVAAAVERFSRTPLGRMLEDPAVKALMDESADEKAREERRARLAELGIDADGVPWPGPMGMSIFVERNVELDADGIGVLVCAEYPSGADTAAKMVDSIIRRLEKETGRGTEQVDLGNGRTAVMVPLPAEEEELGNGQRRPRADPMDGLGEIVATPDSLLYLREGNRFWLASSAAALEDALAAAEGRGGKVLSGTEDWQGASAQLGASDVSVMFFTAPLQPLVRPLMAGPMGPVQPLIQKLFGDIRAWGLGVTVAGESGMVELVSTAFVPGEKQGLISLVSEGVALDAPPAMGGDDAISFMRMNVRFDGIMKVIEDALAALPDMQAEQVAPLLEQWGPGMRKAFGALGPTMWSFTTAAPGSDTGTRSVTVVRCADEKAATALVAIAAPQAGLMPRDFQGGQVYSGEGMDIAVGVGASAVLYGDLAAVEQAMRAASDPAARSLSENAVYRRAAASVKPGAVSAWGYVDAVRSFEINRKALLSESGMMGRMEVAIDDQDEVLDMVPMDIPASTRDALARMDTELMSRYVGPLVYELRPSAKGLAFRMWWLPPAGG